jgi:hypothetical protein
MKVLQYEPGDSARISKLEAMPEKALFIPFGHSRCAARSLFSPYSSIWRNESAEIRQTVVTGRKL